MLQVTRPGSNIVCGTCRQKCHRMLEQRRAALLALPPAGSTRRALASAPSTNMSIIGASSSSKRKAQALRVAASAASSLIEEASRASTTSPRTTRSRASRVTFDARGGDARDSAAAIHVGDGVAGAFAETAIVTPRLAPGDGVQTGEMYEDGGGGDTGGDAVNTGGGGDGGDGGGSDGGGGGDDDSDGDSDSDSDGDSDDDDRVHHIQGDDDIVFGLNAANMSREQLVAAVRNRSKIVRRLRQRLKRETQKRAPSATAKIKWKEAVDNDKQNMLENIVTVLNDTDGLIGQQNPLVSVMSSVFGNARRRVLGTKQARHHPDVLRFFTVARAQTSCCALVNFFHDNWKTPTVSACDKWARRETADPAFSDRGGFSKCNTASFLELLQSRDARVEFIPADEYDVAAASKQFARSLKRWGGQGADTDASIAAAHIDCRMEVGSEEGSRINVKDIKAGVGLPLVQSARAAEMSSEGTGAARAAPTIVSSNLPLELDTGLPGRADPSPERFPMDDKPVVRIAADDTDITGKLWYHPVTHRFMGDCQLRALCPGVCADKYMYSYKEKEDEYLALMAPVYAARHQLLDALEDPDDDSVRIASVACWRALNRVSGYLSGDCFAVIIAEKAEQRAFALQQKRSSYEQKVDGELGSNKLSQLHLLERDVTDIELLRAEATEFAPELAKIRPNRLPDRVIRRSTVAFDERLADDKYYMPEGYDVRAMDRALENGIRLIQEAFIIQRVAATKLLSVRLTDSALFKSECILRLIHASAGISTLDMRNLMHWSVRHVRCMSKDTVYVAALSMDGDYHSMRDAGLTRPTSIVQVARQAVAQAAQLKNRAESLATATEESGKRTQTKWSLVQYVMPHVRHAHVGRLARGMPLLRLSEGCDTRRNIAGNPARTDLEACQFVRTASRRTAFEMKMAGVFPPSAMDLGAAIVRAGYLRDGEPVPESTRLLMYRLEVAVGDKDIGIPVLVGQIAQIIFEARVQKLADEFGVDFRDNAYVPELNPVHACVTVFVEDDPHKRRCYGTHVRDKSNTRSAEVERLINKDNVIAAVHTNEPAMRHIEAILTPSADDQQESTTSELLQNRHLHDALQRLGFAKEAILMKALGEAEQAYKFPGLRLVTRGERILRESRLMRCVMGEALALAEPGASIQGFPTRLLRATVSNADSYFALLRYYPHIKPTLIQHFLSTTDLEHEFSTLVRHVGWKATTNIVLGALRTIDLRMRTRTDPNSHIVQRASTRSKYTHVQCVDARDKSWVDPSLLEFEGEGREAHYAALTKKARAAVKDKRMIRDHHRAW